MLHKPSGDMLFLTEYLQNYDFPDYCSLVSGATILAKTVAPSPLPFCKSGQTFVACGDRNSRQYGLNTGLECMFVNSLKKSTIVRRNASENKQVSHLQLAH